MNALTSPTGFKPKKSVALSGVTAGNTALWTPAAGKKFRLIKYCLVVSGNAAMAAAGVNLISLADGGGGPVPGTLVQLWLPNVAGTVLGGFAMPWIDFGPNGFLSATANNVLNLNINTALTTGTINAIAIGTEE